MLMRRVSAKDRIPDGLLRAALVSGIAVGVATASLGGIGTASGTCIGISGINIGEGCDSSFGNFALGLGEGTVAVAREGFINRAIAIGTNVGAFAGVPEGISVANVALNLGSADAAFSLNPDTGAVVVPFGEAYNGVLAGPGFLNLGANVGGAANDGNFDAVPTPMEIRASGVASSALNFIGNRNSLTSEGIVANTTVLGSFFGDPNGSDNQLTSRGPLSVAFVRQGIFGECPQGPCGNVVTSSGLGAIAGAINTVGRNVEREGFGISIATPGNDTGATANVFAAGNKFSPTAFANVNVNGSGGGQLKASLTKGGKQFSASLKKLSDGFKNALGGLGKKKQDPKTDS